MQSDRRSTPRYAFVATAELIEQSSDTRMSTRVSELALNGCYLDMMNPFPQGTGVLIKIYTDAEFFEAQATVVYSQPNMGMGVKFTEIKPHFAEVLKQWLLRAMGTKTGA